MNTVVLILIFFLSTGEVRTTAIPYTSVRACNVAGRELAYTAIQGPLTKRALWRCETTEDGYDAPLTLPSCHAPDVDCRKG